MREEKRVCLECSKEFILLKDGAGKKYCCEACRIKCNKRKASERWHNVYKYAKQVKREPKIKPAKKTNNIAEIQRKAREAGMSYGKYMLEREMRRIG